MPLGCAPLGFERTAKGGLATISCTACNLSQARITLQLLASAVELQALHGSMNGFARKVAINPVPVKTRKAGDFGQRIQIKRRIEIRIDMVHNLLQALLIPRAIG